MNMWQLTLKVHPDGLIQATGLSDGIPPGEIEIRGGDDGNRITLEARQRDPQGRFVIAAYHRRDRAEEALHDLEAAADEAIAVVTGAGDGLATGGFLSGESTAVVGE